MYEVLRVARRGQGATAAAPPDTPWRTRWPDGLPHSPAGSGRGCRRNGLNDPNPVGSATVPGKAGAPDCRMTNPNAVATVHGGGLQGTATIG